MEDQVRQVQAADGAREVRGLPGEESQAQLSRPLRELRGEDREVRQVWGHGPPVCQHRGSQPERPGQRGGGVPERHEVSP